MIDQLPPNPVLQEIFRTGMLNHPSGQRLKTAANIGPQNSLALYETVLKHRPKIVIEIGMAYGISTLSILTALQKIGTGRLISIDPYIGWPTGKIVAEHNIKMAGLGEFHEHIQSFSHLALPKLLSEGMTVDFAYVDGAHTFDYCFVDFFYLDKLLVENGIVAFNDCGWRSVHKVICFLDKWRHYKEMDVGLPKKHKGANPLFSIIKFLEGRSTNDRYFQKTKEWEPPSDAFYRSF